METEEPSTFQAQTDSYYELAEHLRGLYNGTISEPELHEATRNLIGFCQLLLEIKVQSR